MDCWIHHKSFIKGIQAIEKPLHFFKPEYWHIEFHKTEATWFHIWTPVWHKGRGPYVSIGFKFFRLIRGY